MTDKIDAQGLTVKTLPQIIADLESAMRDIYGEDINLDQNSPDGQLVNIFAQAGADIRELAVMINNGFNPDRAFGRTLDERVVINNIERRGGTYTIQPIDITVDRTVTLQGLDAAFNDPDGQGFTVQDDAGNQFILIDTDTLTAGTHRLNFRARDIGRVETVVQTITNPVTIVLGVTDIENVVGAIDIGQEEETDAQLRLRRQRSVAIASTGYLNGLLASVLNLEGVVSAKLFENVSNVEDADGIPAHGIWLIVQDGASTDIANEIYTKKSYGANMKGDVEVEILTDSGAVFKAKFDRPEAQDLHIRFDIQTTIPGAVFDQNTIKQEIVDTLFFDIGEFAETSRITAIARAAIEETGGGGVPVNLEVSDDGNTWVDFLETDTKKDQFALDTTRITITEL